MTGRSILAGLLLLATVVAGIAIAPGASPAAAQGIRILLDGRELSFDVAPRIVENRTLVPMRAIFQAYGAGVEWDEENRIVTARKGGHTLVLPIDAPTATLDGTVVRLDVPARIFEGRTMVPLRFVSETLGAAVRWDGAARTVHLATRSDSDRVVEGFRLSQAKNCRACHRINGSGGGIGPDLGGVTGRYSEAWLRNWLKDPQAVRPGTSMPTFGLSDDEIDALISYLKTVE